MDKIEEALTRGVETILPSKKALKALMEKSKISLYQGFDPSSPNLHIGNMIGLRKLAQFQKLGHKVIFLIGDFTGMIGDPTDKSAARRKLTKNEVLQNTKTYKKQVENIISFGGSNPAQISFNSEWLSKLDFADIVELSSHFTVQQLIERDFFQERIKDQKPIFLHEFLYPLMQGYDSVVLDVDLEIGGNDQFFNMLAGRTLRHALETKEKFVLSMKLMVDPTGKKMGKSEGNTINLTDSPRDIFGKVMALPDSLIDPGIELMSDLPLGFSKGKTPLNAKKALALDIVRQVYGEKKASEARKEFENTFQKKQVPSRTESVKVAESEAALLDLVFAAMGQSSRSEAKRLIVQSAVDVDSKTVSDPSQTVQIPKRGVVLKIGKTKFVKITQEGQ